MLRDVPLGSLCSWDQGDGRVTLFVIVASGRGISLGGQVDSGWTPRERGDSSIVIPIDDPLFVGQLLWRWADRPNVDVLAPQ